MSQSLKKIIKCDSNGQRQENKANEIPRKQDPC